jgi:hypothetical protein
MFVTEAALNLCEYPLPNALRKGGASPPDSSGRSQPLPAGRLGHSYVASICREELKGRQIKHVSINRSSQPACSFDPKDLGYETPVLGARHNRCDGCFRGGLLRINLACGNRYRQWIGRLQHQLEVTVIGDLRYWACAPLFNWRQPASGKKCCYLPSTSSFFFASSFICLTVGL